MINLQHELLRSRTLKAVRAFFDTQSFQEVEIPIFSESLPLEPNIYSFNTTWHAVNKKTIFYLPTSPESMLKKCLAAGMGNCYGIGHTFRNLEGSSTLHFPEFLMLEWYREKATYTDIMNDVQKLVFSMKEQFDRDKKQKPSPILQFREKEFDLQKKWPILSLEEMSLKYAGLDIAKIASDEKYFFSLARKKGYNVNGATWGQLFDQIFLNEVESHLPGQPCFLIDFPARMSPLCKVNEQKPYLADRFEAFIGGIEIANGNNENTDADRVRQRMEIEQTERQRRNASTHPIDEEFLSALQKMGESGKRFAGIGLGVDRIGMILENRDSITGVYPIY